MIIMPIRFFFVKNPSTEELMFFSVQVPNIYKKHKIVGVHVISSLILKIMLAKYCSSS